VTPSSLNIHSDDLTPDCLSISISRHTCCSFWS